MKNNKLYTNSLLYIFLLIIGSSFKMISNSQLNESDPIEDTVHLLQRAVLENNQTEIVKILNESKISIDTYAVYKDDNVLNQNAVMWTPMGIACIKGNLEMVKFLIEQGASIEEGYYDEWFGYSSLFAAVEGGNYH